MFVRRTLVAASIFVFIGVSLITPPSTMAESYLMTAFVPELATPTLGIHYGYHSDHLGDYNLNRATTSMRFAYVPHPGLEAHVDLSLLDYTLEEFSEKGMGAGLAVKYQFAELFEDLDFGIAVLASAGMGDTIDETNLAAVVLASRDISEGLTPFGGVGFSRNHQNFNGQIEMRSVDETRSEPVIFIGLKYMIKNRLGIAFETLIHDGAGLELSVSYRF